MEKRSATFSLHPWPPKRKSTWSIGPTSKSCSTSWKLNLSGIVAPDEATRVGHLTGAKILVTGSVIEVGNSLYIVAKMIGTETSRVLGQSVKGKTGDELGPLVEKLAEQVAAAITGEADKLVAKEPKREERVEALEGTNRQGEASNGHGASYRASRGTVHLGPRRTDGTDAVLHGKRFHGHRSGKGRCGSSRRDDHRRGHQRVRHPAG